MALNGLYQKLRDEIVSLTLDIEDKDNICVLLEKKVAAERASLASAEKDTLRHFEELKEAEDKGHENYVSKIETDISELNRSKKKLLLECKGMLDEVSQTEKELSIAVSRITREANLSIERERNLFRNSSEERLQKFLSSKGLELKESTARALQPEISRLQQMHQRELAEVESQAMAQERQLNEDIQRQLLSMVEEEKAAARDRQRQLLSEAQTRLAEEVQRLEEAHRQKFSHMQVDMDAEIDRFRSALELRNERDRRKGQQEIKITQEHTQSLLSEIQAKHSQEMTNLFKDHQAQMRLIMSSKSTASAASESKSSHREPLVDEDSLRSDINESLQSLLAERDKRIQNEIRQLQTESLRLERAAKGRFDEERAAVVEESKAEEERQTKRIKQLTDQLADLAVDKEKISSRVDQLSFSCEQISLDVAAATKELKVYEEAIATYRQKIFDCENECRHVDERLRSESQRLKSQQQSRLFVLRDRQSEAERALERDLSDLMDSHDKELGELDRQVKELVSAKDTEIMRLKDSIQVEKAKIAKLEKLILNYSESK